MNVISKAAVAVGTGYVAGSGIKAIAGAPFAAIGGAVALGFLIIVCGAIFDWTDLDRTIHYAGAIIGFISACAVIGLFWSGEVAPAVAIIVLGGLGWLVALPISHAIDQRWDTPERQTGEFLSKGCAYVYTYSWTDGYCHFDHEFHEDVYRIDHGAYAETLVPSDGFGLGQPLPGARENIARLKAAATPEPTPATEATTKPVRMTFFGTVVYQLTRPVPWLIILAVGVFGYFQDRRKAAGVQQSEVDQHAWLAEGRRAAGLD